MRCWPKCSGPMTRAFVGRPATPTTLLPRLRPSQRHTARPNAGIEHRPRHQPRRAYAASTAAGTPHALQHLADGLPLVEACQIGDGEGALAAATGRLAVNREIEARQFRQRAG